MPLTLFKGRATFINKIISIFAAFFMGAKYPYDTYGVVFIK